MSPEIDDEQGHEDEGHQAQVGKGPVAHREPGPGEGQPESLVHESRQGENKVLHEEPEGQGDQSHIRVAEPGTQEADNDAQCQGYQASRGRRRRSASRDCSPVAPWSALRPGEGDLAGHNIPPAR